MIQRITYLVCDGCGLKLEGGWDYPATRLRDDARVKGWDTFRDRGQVLVDICPGCRKLGRNRRKD